MRWQYFWRFGRHVVTVEIGRFARVTVGHDGMPMGAANAFFHWGQVDFMAQEEGRAVPYSVRVHVGPYGMTRFRIQRADEDVVGWRPVPRA